MPARPHPAPDALNRIGKVCQVVSTFAQAKDADFASAARRNLHPIAYFFIKDLGRLEASRAIAIGGTGEPWAETLNLLISSTA